MSIKAESGAGGLRSRSVRTEVSSVGNEGRRLKVKGQRLREKSKSDLPVRNYIGLGV